MRINNRIASGIGLLSASLVVLPACGVESLPVLTPETVPHTVQALYADFNPDKEPLEVAVIKEYEQQGVTVRMLTFTVGTFKGVKSKMGAYYAFPRQRKGPLPAILQMHGGGQVAQAETVIAWAQNGYAAMALNWGGKTMKDQGAHDPGTDWGAVDATQAGHNSHYGSCMPDAKTLDAFESPRNSNWYLITLAAKRAVSVLEQQSEVDRTRIGATGHSMGGKLTVMLAGCDSRIKAATPSCGGVGSAPEKLKARPGNAARPNNTSKIDAETIDDANYIRQVKCPILYVGPQNDFNGLIDELFMNWEQIGSDRVAFAISKHLNHRQEQAVSFVEALWFEQYLKGSLILPLTPKISVQLKGPKGIPMVTVTPDRVGEVTRMEIFYSIDPNGQFRFWRSVEAKRVGNVWVADCAILSDAMPLFFMANVHYPFPAVNLIGPPWNKMPGPDYLLSTKVISYETAEVKVAAPAVTDVAERLIEKDFTGLQDWYVLEAANSFHREIVTRKVKDPKWRGPDGARLAIDVLDPRGGSLVLDFEFNGYGQYGRDKVSGEFYAVVPLKAVPEWQTLSVGVSDLKPLKPVMGTLANWQTLCTLSIKARLDLQDAGKTTTLGEGLFDNKRQLSNLRWLGGAYPASILMPGGVSLDPKDYEKQFQSQIDQSIKLEKREGQVL